MLAGASCKRVAVPECGLRGGGRCNSSQALSAVQKLVRAREGRVDCVHAHEQACGACVERA